MIDENTFDGKHLDFNGTMGLVYIGKEILVYRRDDKAPSWPLCVGLPGGGREGNETPFETFSREVKEEFDLNIKEEDIVYSKKYDSIEKLGKFSYFMVAKSKDLTEKDIVFGSEGLYHFLMDPVEYSSLEDAVTPFKARINSYLETLK